MTKRNSIDHATMREMNLALILRTIRSRSPLSRADLAQHTGLNKATVSSLVRDLLAADWVREVGTVNGTADVGRPAIHLEPNPGAGYFIGVEIGVHFILLVTADFSMAIVSRRYESTHRLYGQEDILQRVIWLIKESAEQIGRLGKPLFGIGVGLPGLVDVASGRLIIAPNLGWQNVNLSEHISSHFQAPVYIANEANLAALGESSFGAGQGLDSMLYVSSGVGLGGGIVAGGRLEEGASGFAGEVGHMIVERDGLPCNCGSFGCWETVAGEQALFARAQRALAAGEAGLLAELTGGDPQRLNVNTILKAAEGGDPAAHEALQKTGIWLGIGIASLMNVLNPQRVVFGGPLSTAHEHLLPAIRETVKQRSWKWVSSQAAIVPAAFGENAAVMGGVAMAYRELVKNPRRWLNVAL